MKTKKDIFKEVQTLILEQGMEFVSKDDSRPWGGFFVIANQSAEKFANFYFDTNIPLGQKISPKLLIVQPNTRLSWQYHFRRFSNLPWHRFTYWGNFYRSGDHQRRSEPCFGNCFHSCHLECCRKHWSDFLG